MKNSSLEFRNEVAEFEFRSDEPFTITVEKRDGESDLIKVEGHAAVFDQETEIGGMFREKIEAGAFAKSIRRGDDVPFLINHDGLPLARTSSKTLHLSEDSTGLKIRTELDASDPDVARIVPKMKRGDLSKMSFAFTVNRQEWSDEDEDDKIPLRTLRELNLHDVSIVTNPAYGGTDIGLRSLEEMKKSKEDKEKETEQKRKNFAAARKRVLERKHELKIRENKR